jgi:hypothetical protein
LLVGQEALQLEADDADLVGESSCLLAADVAASM